MRLARMEYGVRMHCKERLHRSHEISSIGCHAIESRNLAQCSESRLSHDVFLSLPNPH